MSQLENHSTHGPISSGGDIRIRQDWKSFVEKISYKGVVDNLPFIGFIVMLCVCYIANMQHGISVQGELNKNTETLKELRWRYVDAKVRLLNAEMESEIIRNAAEINLSPLDLPAFVLYKDTVNLKSRGHARRN